MRTEWRDVPGFEGYYTVSNRGDVYSVRSKMILKHTRSKVGYSTVHLWKGRVNKMCSVHRIVALAFIENNLKLPEVNHKDEDKTNNTVENLEWCTRKYNQTYGTKVERVSRKNLKPVRQLDKDGNEIARYAGIRDAANALNIKHRNAITQCCRGTIKTAYGWRWEYVS